MGGQTGFSARRRRREQADFEGRERELEVFRTNLALAVESPEFANVLAVHGQGGVGKTWLLRRFEAVARQLGAVTAFVNEDFDSVPTVMAACAAQLREQQHPLAAFDERYADYRKKLGEIQADPNAPATASVFGSVVSNLGLAAAK
ncbi:MAG: ATP-binding protein, partial [Planctomycetes bacterium]|nr:ATP-binding protein [Planctomycetota bacterium]